MSRTFFFFFESFFESVELVKKDKKYGEMWKGI